MFLSKRGDECNYTVYSHVRNILQFFILKNINKYLPSYVTATVLLRFTFLSITSEWCKSASQFWCWFTKIIKIIRPFINGETVCIYIFMKLISLLAIFRVLVLYPASILACSKAHEPGVGFFKVSTVQFSCYSSHSVQTSAYNHFCLSYTVQSTVKNRPRNLKNLFSTASALFL